MSLTGLAEPEEVRTLFVTDGVLPMPGVQPMLGRVFSKADDAPGGTETVVLTSGYWRSKFGGDRSAIGRTLMLDSRPREIIGVLRDTFRFLDRDVSLVVPFQFDRSKVFLGQFSYSAIARLQTPFRRRQRMGGMLIRISAEMTKGLLAGAITPAILGRPAEASCRDRPVAVPASGTALIAHRRY